MKSFDVQSSLVSFFDSAETSDVESGTDSLETTCTQNLSGTATMQGKTSINTTGIDSMASARERGSDNVIITDTFRRQTGFSGNYPHIHNVAIQRGQEEAIFITYGYHIYKDDIQGKKAGKDSYRKHRFGRMFYHENILSKKQDSFVYLVQGADFLKQVREQIKKLEAVEGNTSFLKVANEKMIELWSKRMAKARVGFPIQRSGLPSWLKARHMEEVDRLLAAAQDKMAPGDWLSHSDLPVEQPRKRPSAGKRWTSSTVSQTPSKYRSKYSSRKQPCV